MLDWAGRPVAVRSQGGERVYSRGRDAWPSVTTVIGRVFPHLYQQIPGRALEHAQARGRETHRGLALLYGADPGYTLDWASLDDEVGPRVHLLDEWLRSKAWIPMHVERAFYSEVYGIAGTPDQVGYFADRPEEITILDFKPWIAPTADLQLAGYALCVSECLGLERAPKRVSLNCDGRRALPVEYINHSRDRSEFLGTLAAYRCGARKGWWSV